MTGIYKFLYLILVYDSKMKKKKLRGKKILRNCSLDVSRMIIFPGVSFYKRERDNYCEEAYLFFDHDIIFGGAK